MPEPTVKVRMKENIAYFTTPKYRFLACVFNAVFWQNMQIYFVWLCHAFQCPESIYFLFGI
tara:strand:+ start:1396 stop:1578 length:183 start_codon:yes stop_codon:yes gene_type:complete